MTAIIGVLNKHAAAIAADSAATLSGGMKVMNSANKLFALSKHQPVAIAVYGNAEMVGMPWEIVIKEFRRDLADSVYSTLQEYADKFFEFIAKKNYFCDDAEALLYLRGALTRTFTDIVSICDRNAQKIEKILLNFERVASRALNYRFTNDTIDFFNNNTNKEMEEGIRYLKSLGVSMDASRIKTIITDKFIRDVPPATASGLVFVGYGENEIFPSICHYTIGSVINGLMAQIQHPQAEITRTNSSCICPFAQTDVMQTILNGVAPQIQDIYMNSLSQTFTKITDALSKLIATTNPVLAEQVKHLDMTPFSNMFLVSSQKTQRELYTQPFVNSVASLEKEDLADFAESLITLTSLKRKVSPEQDTVGGPVDVMVISKGDGIIWMKRKHYFKPELNHHFFDNYFNQ